MKKRKRTGSLYVKLALAACVVMMAFSMKPAFTAKADETEYEDTDESEYEDSYDITTSLDANGVLTISGTGKMPTAQCYSHNKPFGSVVHLNRTTKEWGSRDSIYKVVIMDGVTSIGANSFAGCENLREVIIGKDVTEIGEYAFELCPNLTYIDIPKNVQRISASAFERSGLKKVKLHEGLQSIGAYAFWGSQLGEVTIPKNTRIVETGAFSGMRSAPLHDVSCGVTNAVISEGVGEIATGAFNKVTVDILDKNVVLNAEAFHSESTLNVYADSTGYEYCQRNSCHYGVYPINVTLDAMGGTCSVTKIKATPFECYGALATPTRSGYAFAGWYTGKNGGSKVGSWTTVGVKDHTLYARWTRLTKIKFDAADGEGIVSTLQILPGKKFGTLPEVIRDGYVFAGWYTEVSGGTQVSDKTVVEDQDYTLYARWIKKSTVKFNAVGGMSTVTSKKMTPGKAFGTLPKATRSGYIFGGWYTAKRGGSKISSRTKVAGKDYTLYARWIRKSRVKYNAAGGRTSVSAKLMIPGRKFGTLPKATRKGYIFDGWYTAKRGGTKVSSRTLVGKKDYNLYAHWKKVTVGKANGVKLASSSKKRITVSYKRVKGAVGYQIRYSANKNMKGARIIMTRTARKTVRYGYSKKRVYVQVRAFKKDPTGNRVYGSWSKRCSVKVR